MTKKSKKLTTKRVKAWAQITGKGEIVVLKIDFPFGVFPSKEIAHYHNIHNNYEPYKIVPIEIIYTP